jgi:hypothetical protein
VSEHKKLKMKKLFLRALLITGFSVCVGNSYGQTSVANCPKKGTSDCPIVKNCPMKGTKDCPYTASFASVSTHAAKAENCPLKGTPDCPLIKNCSKKNSPDCPLVSLGSKASYAAKISKSGKRDNADLPPCCKKM